MLQINIDFKILHRTKTNLLFEKWKVVGGHLLKLLKEASLSDVDKAYLDIVPTLSSGIYNMINHV